MRKEMEGNSHETQKTPRRLLGRVAVALGLAVGGASLIPTQNVEASSPKTINAPGPIPQSGEGLGDFRIKGISVPEQGQTPEQVGVHKVDAMQTFSFTDKEKDMAKNGNITPEPGSALDNASKALKDEYKMPDGIVTQEVAWNKDMTKVVIYDRFIRDQKITTENDKELDFTPGSVIYSGGHYLIAKDGQTVAPSEVDSNLKDNFFNKVTLGKGTLTSPEEGDMVLLAKDSKTNNVKVFLTEDLAYNVDDSTQIKSAPAVPSPDAPRAKMGEVENSQNTIDLKTYNGTPWTGEYAVTLDTKIKYDVDAKGQHGTLTIGNKPSIKIDSSIPDGSNIQSFNLEGTDGFYTIDKRGKVVGIIGTRMIQVEPIAGVPPQIEVIDVLVVSKDTQGNTVKQIVSIPSNNAFFGPMGGNGDIVANKDQIVARLTPGKLIFFSFNISKTGWSNLAPAAPQLATKVPSSFTEDQKAAKRIGISLLAATDSYRSNLLSIGTKSEKTNCYLGISFSTKY